MLEKMNYDEFKSSVVKDLGVEVGNFGKLGDKVYERLSVNDSFDEKLKSFLNPFDQISVHSYCGGGVGGFIFYKPEYRPCDRQEKAVYIEHKFYNIKEETLHEKEDNFRRAYEEASYRNYYMECLYLPKKLRAGFVVLTGDGAVSHTINMRDFNIDFTEINPDVKDGNRRRIADKYYPLESKIK